MSERIFEDANFVIGKAIIDRLEEFNRKAIEFNSQAAADNAYHLYELQNHPTPHLSLDDEDLVQRK